MADKKNVNEIHKDSLDSVITEIINKSKALRGDEEQEKQDKIIKGNVDGYLKITRRKQKILDHFTRGHDDFYETLKKELNKEKIDENQKGNKIKNDQFEKIISKALIAYFKKVSPQVAKIAEEGYKSDPKKQYEHLTAKYAEHLGQYGSQIVGSIENWKKSHETVGEILTSFKKETIQYSDIATREVIKKASKNLLEPIKNELHKYIPRAYKKIKVKDKTRFLQDCQNRPDDIVQGVIDNKYGEKGPEEYGIEVKDYQPQEN